MSIDWDRRQGTLGKHKHLTTDILDEDTGDPPASAGSQTLAQVLALGNDTGGVVGSGPAIVSASSSSSGLDASVTLWAVATDVADAYADRVATSVNGDAHARTVVDVAGVQDAVGTVLVKTSRGESDASIRAEVTHANGGSAYANALAQNDSTDGDAESKREAYSQDGDADVTTTAYASGDGSADASLSATSFGDGIAQAYSNADTYGTEPAQAGPATHAWGSGHADSTSAATTDGAGHAIANSIASANGSGNALASSTATANGGNAQARNDAYSTSGSADARMSATQDATELSVTVRVDGSGAKHLIMVGVPTADPHVVNEVWVNAGVLTISTG